MTSVYGMSFANIVPESFWTRFLLVTFRILIDIVILQGLFTMWSVVRENRKEALDHHTDSESEMDNSAQEDDVFLRRCTM